ncbi:MAG: hypothetical protein BGO40_06765 [Chryseobacterium sp. 39-10]|nr:glycosyltransferase [Chryseobacterium sp.]OJV47985.1 MAG: hypothetical protein BGO40_06765 [Chryseobacterium sp. 39-10]
MTKSVCIATYNGSRFIAKQIDSVLAQLSVDDELIIVDDGSTDQVVKIIENYDDSRIRIFVNPRNMRHVKTFERAVRMAENEMVILCDQDDIWTDNRVAVLENYFAKNPGVVLITSNCVCIDDHDREIAHTIRTVNEKDSFAYKKNILSILRGKIGYYGCLMAFRQSLKKIILPIPSYVEAHDLWIAMAANLLHQNLHINEITLKHRLHASNASDLSRGFWKKVSARKNLMRSIVELNKRIANLTDESQ